jgi:DNA-binding CsgD family transcriptional regulator
LLLIGVEKLNFGLKKMYKMIQLTDKELELLASMIQYYIDQKKNKPDFEINNAHIMLRHISGKLSHNNRNQIAFLGK